MAGNAEASNSLKRRSPGGQARASDNVETVEVNNVMTNSIAKAVEHNAGMSYETLIPVQTIEIDGELVKVCNAKDVFICLGVRSRFNDWIARRISEYGFIENSDYFLVTQEKVIKGRGGDRRSKRYDVTIDMAKELAMVERTEVGQRIRRYFIACEKALRKIAPEVAAECLRKALSPEQQFILKGKVDSKVACLEHARRRSGYQELWGSLKARHQVAQYRDISSAEFEEACQFVESYTWEGEWLGKEPEVEFTDWLNLNCLITCMQRSHEIFTKYNLYAHLTGLGSRSGIEIIDYLADGRGVASMLERQYSEPLSEALSRARGVCDQALNAQEGRISA